MAININIMCLLSIMYGAHTDPGKGLEKAETATERCAQYPCNCTIISIKKFRH